MEPEIRFCTGPDGIRIAYTAVGEGPPLLFVPSWCFNIELIWRKSDLRHLLESLSREHLFVMFDRRGVGCSERDVDDLSLEAQIRDIHVVADHLQIQRFNLCGAVDGSSVSVAYAARCPERVSRLVLWAPYPRGSEVITRNALDSLLGLIRNNWSVARRALSDITFPTGPTQSQRWFADLLRQSVSQETAARCLEFQNTVDVATFLPQVKAPTLILHRRDCSGVPIDAGRACAALIPDVRFVTLEGDILHPFFGDTSHVSTMVQFLEEDGGSRKSTDFSSISDTAREPQPGRLEGKTISHYRIIEKLGEGGMGVVYKAEDMRLKRMVALKFLPPELTRSDEWHQRFLREAQAAAALAHPNICTIYEVDEVEGQTFIAMECVEGKQLTELIEPSPLDPDKAIDLAIQLAEGLQEAHEKGIIHRDIKAANIMVTRRGHARIMDFGLAKLTGQTGLTKTATVMGTVAYMSPEQAHGKSAIDHRTDIWSLGVVLYEMLTGRRPFAAPTDAGLIYKVVHEEPEPIDALRAGIPVALAQAVKKMMQKEPEDRYGDMGALISDLKAIRAGATPRIVLEEKSAPSIAVLPFVDMSPRKDQEYFCDGVAESLINALTQLSELKVIARTSAFSFKGQNLDVREIGKKLGVGTVLEGSIQKAGDRIRVTAQLVDTTRGEHLWSEKYDREARDIFAIQDEISDAIVARLKPKLLGEQKVHPTKRQAVDLELYNLYLKARWFWSKRTPDGLEKSIEYFEQAIAKNPNYAMAYAGLADSYISLPTWIATPAKEAYQKGEQLALKALEIDEGLAEAHASLAFTRMLSYNWPGAQEEDKRALALNPGYAQGHLYYAFLLTILDRHEEALQEADTALQLDPLSLTMHIYSGLVFNFAGEHDRAIDILKRAIEMDPGFGLAHFSLGIAYTEKSMYEEALEEHEKEEKLARSNPIFSLLGRAQIYAGMGDNEELRRLLETALQESSKSYVLPYGMATLFFSLGQNDTGFQWLERAYEERDITMCFLLRTDPVLDNIRSDPRYLDLLDKMNLPKPAATAATAEQSPSIAVLPFVNMSADPEQEYFCDGMAEELINALTQIRDLKVIARTSAFSFKHKDVDIQEIGRKLGVKSVLEGSVRKAGNKLRITAQLVETSRGHHLWSERYDRELDDIFAIQDEITLAIVDNLKPMLLGKERARIAKRQTVDIEAHNLFLQGRFFWNRQSGTAHKKAIEFFERAVQKEPDYAQAWAGIADSYGQLPFYSFSSPREIYPKAREAALKALEVNDSLAEGHTSLGFLKTNYERDWEGAEKEYGRAIELNPGYAVTRFFYCWHLTFMGRYNEAIEQIERALELDPLSVVINRDMGSAYLYAGKYDKAIEAWQKTIAMDVSFTFVHYFLGLAYLFSSRLEEAAREFERELQYMGDFDPMREGWAGQGFALLGDLRKAGEIRDRLLDASKRGYVSPYLLGAVHIAMEDKDEGFLWLEKAYEEMDPLLGFLKPDSGFRPIGSDPRYVALLRKMNLEP